jgi:hypothetical protein
MDKQLLKDLGITRKDVLDKLVDRLQEAFMPMDADGDGSGFEAELHKEMTQRIEEGVRKALCDFTAPAIAEYCRKFVLNPTSEWGEKKGDSLTFVDYLVKSGRDFLEQPVDPWGKPANTYGSDKKKTRLAFLATEALSDEIRKAAESYLKNQREILNKAMADALMAKAGEIVRVLKG